MIFENNEKIGNDFDIKSKQFIISINPNENVNYNYPKNNEKSK